MFRSSDLPQNVHWLAPILAFELLQIECVLLKQDWCGVPKI